MFQNLGEEIRKGGKTRRQAAGGGDGKEEGERRERSSTGGCCETSSLGYETGFRASKANGFGVWRADCRKNRWWR